MRYSISTMIKFEDGIGSMKYGIIDNIDSSVIGAYELLTQAEVALDEIMGIKRITDIECPYCHAPVGSWCVTASRWTEENQHNFHPSLAHVERQRIIIEHNREIRDLNEQGDSK